MSAELLTEFQWKPCPEGQKIVDALIADFLADCPRTTALAEAMKQRAGSRFLDWIDYLVVMDDGAQLCADLLAAGFVLDAAGNLFAHPGAIFPRVMIAAEGPRKVVLKVDSVADFLATHAIQTEVEGMPLGQMRQACAWTGANTEFWVVERHGWRGLELPEVTEAQAIASQRHLELFRRRQRKFANDDASFASLHGLIDAAIADVGRDWTCDLFFAAERDFWMRRNRAARVQKARQDALGLGWANHDHHTYRCRRATFHLVMELFEKLGIACRERFYAGAEAGWGAQVLEGEESGIIIFADVDMSVEELTGDFSHEGFVPRDGLGTVGLWCELHGDSLFGAGMHHLECQFSFDALREQMLEEAGIEMMKPFTDFAFLRQQFTRGERWQIDPDRVDRVLAMGEITEAQAEQFKTEGGIGSHMENLERNDGFKGFNQTGINDIIAKTDPRRQLSK